MEDAVQSTRKAIFSVVLTVCFVAVVFSSQGLGHARDQHGEWKVAVSPSEGRCTEGLARVADGSFNKGFVRSTTWSRGLSYTNSCFGEKEKVAGNIAVRWFLVFTNGGEYHACTGTTWKYNQAQTVGKSIYWDFGWTPNPGPPCGAGRYKNRAGSFVKNQGNWIGGYTFSPEHAWPVVNREAGPDDDGAPGDAAPGEGLVTPPLQ